MAADPPIQRFQSGTMELSALLLAKSDKGKGDKGGDAAARRAQIQEQAHGPHAPRARGRAGLLDAVPAPPPQLAPRVPQREEGGPVISVATAELDHGT